MRMSTLLFPTRRATSQSATQANAEALAVRAGLIRRVSGGVYSFLPIGLRVVRRMEALLRRELARAGAAEILLPVLQPRSWWQAGSGSGRWDAFGDQIVTADGVPDACLSPSSEELMVNVLKSCGPLSYRGLPLLLFHVGPRFRTSRGAHGLHRAHEFLLAEIYGASETPGESEALRRRMQEALVSVLSGCGLAPIVSSPLEAKTIGHVSTNFHVISSMSSDRTLRRCDGCGALAGNDGPADDVHACSRCGGTLSDHRVLNLAQVSDLGQRYSDAFGLTVTNREGIAIPVWLSGGGLSLQRLFVAVLENCGGPDGIAWPASVAPFDVSVVALGTTPAVEAAAEAAYAQVRDAGLEVVWDDRPLTAGEKLMDGDLLGAPLRVTCGPRGAAQDSVDVTVRRSRQTQSVPSAQLIETLLRIRSDLS